jgi:ADP-ribose pyrophosphatase
MDERPWDVLARETVFSAPPWLDLTREHVRLPDGREIESWWIVDVPPYAMVAATDGEGRVLAVRHYKHAVGRVHWSLPAGYVEPGEAPLACARRELLEETGYRADRWTSLGSFIVDGNRNCGTAHLFLAEGIERVAEPDSGDLEEMEVALLPLSDLLAMLRAGDVPQVTAAAGIALAALALNSSPD